MGDKSKKPMVLRNGPIAVSQHEIDHRADDLVANAEKKKWEAKEAVLAWMCASGNVVANLSDKPEEVQKAADLFISFFKSTVRKVSQK